MTSKTTETASGTSTDDRTSFVVGNITNASSTVSSVSTADLAILAVGETISHAAFPAGTTVVSKSSSSFVASANATATASSAVIGFENRLNQIMKQVVTPAGGSPATWRYSYNLNGAMTGKTDGTNTWTYTWDDDDRLTRVQGPGVDVSCQYDSNGRMLTRASGGVTTKFTWDGWNCVKEDDGTNVFRWYCPEGELHSFERNSTFYQVHSDALGSIRAITDSSGGVVGSYTYGPWGQTLSASHPSGFSMPYLMCGSLGVRFDSATGLHYMRHRWYDAGLGRFLSRDPIPAGNFYSYVLNSPMDSIDPYGLDGPGGPGGPVLVRPVPPPMTGPYNYPYTGSYYPPRPGTPGTGTASTSAMPGMVTIPVRGPGGGYTGVSQANVVPGAVSVQGYYGNFNATGMVRTADGWVPYILGGSGEIMPLYGAKLARKAPDLGGSIITGPRNSTGGSGPTWEDPDGEILTDPLEALRRRRLAREAPSTTAGGGCDPPDWCTLMEKSANNRFFADLNPYKSATNGPAAIAKIASLCREFIGGGGNPSDFNDATKNPYWK